MARGELSLVKLRERIEGRPSRQRGGHEAEIDDVAGPEEGNGSYTPEEMSAEAQAAWTGVHPKKTLTDESLVTAKQQLANAVEDLVDVLREPDLLEGIGEVDRSNLAKYLTIAKLRLENAITLVRRGDAG